MVSPLAKKLIVYLFDKFSLSLISRVFHELKIASAVINLFRAIPFEKLVGVCGVGLLDHPAVIFLFFLGYPAVISQKI